MMARIRVSPKYRWKDTRAAFHFLATTMPDQERAMMKGSKLWYNRMDEIFRSCGVYVIVFGDKDNALTFLPSPFARKNVLVDISLISL